jgi:hypothetical protein
LKGCYIKCISSNTLKISCNITYEYNYK